MISTEIPFSRSIVYSASIMSEFMGFAGLIARATSFFRPGRDPLPGLGAGPHSNTVRADVDGVERNRVVSRIRGDGDRVRVRGDEHAAQSRDVTVGVAASCR